MFDCDTLQTMLNYAIQAHSRLAKNENKRYRKFDHKTPYAIHPIWCALTMMHEISIPESIRTIYVQALLFHDVLEDTNASLPDYLSEQTKKLVQEMTFASSQEEHDLIISGKMRPEIMFLKLYDKISNYMHTDPNDEARQIRYREKISILYDSVSKHFPKVYILKIARELIT